MPDPQITWRDDKTRGDGLTVNGKRPETPTFGEHDKIVVLAED